MYNIGKALSSNSYNLAKAFPPQGSMLGSLQSNREKSSLENRVSLDRNAYCLNCNLCKCFKNKELQLVHG